MKYLIPTIAIALLTLGACQSENKTETTTTDTGGTYVEPTTGSAGMTIPDRDTPFIETQSPELLKKTDSAMQQNASQPQAY